MAHFRSTVTDAIAARIGTNGVTVKNSRVYPTSEGALPRYLVYGLLEDTDWSSSVGTALRTLSVQIEVLLNAAADDVEDNLNDHCEYIENRLNPAQSIANVLWSRVTRTELELHDTGQQALGIAKLTVEVAYRTLTTEAATQT